jgi:hypothetical protein
MKGFRTQGQKEIENKQIDQHQEIKYNGQGKKERNLYEEVLEKERERKKYRYREETDS